MSTHKAAGRAKYKFDDSINHIHEYGLDLAASQLYLSGESNYITDIDSTEPGVEFLMSAKFIKNIQVLMRMKPNDPILVHMKTCGGDWTEGMAIHNIIQACPNPVTILSYTHARSMSSLIFQAANKRVMMPDSYFMFHDGTSGHSGTVKQVESSFYHEQGLKERMLDIYIESMKREGKFSKWSPSKIKTMLRDLMDKKEDVYLSAKEAVEWGLADEIFGAGGKYDWPALTSYTTEHLQR